MESWLAFRKKVRPEVKELAANAIGRKIQEWENRIGIACKEQEDLIKWLFFCESRYQRWGFLFISGIREISPGE